MHKRAKIQHETRHLLGGLRLDPHIWGVPFWGSFNNFNLYYLGFYQANFPIGLTGCRDALSLL
jgi:hypothetical protein